MPLQKVVSGGQTGVDRAALDAAVEAGLPVGGWCPAGRRAEDGPLPRRYPLRETPSPDYAQRTTWNVRDSDGTLILLRGEAEGGTALTAATAEARGKPWLMVQVDGQNRAAAVEATLAWMEQYGVAVLNVAGPREAEEAGIYGEARRFLTALYEQARHPS